MMAIRYWHVSCLESGRRGSQNRDPRVCRLSKGEIMMNRTSRFLTVFAGLALTASALASAQEPTGYKIMAGHYEEIRLALLDDSMNGIAGHAEGIRQAAEKLRRQFDAATASVPEDRSAECVALLPEIRDTAASLASKNTIEDVRETFGELSKLMVRYRRMVNDPGSVVVYCSMAEKVWIQPKGEIGNPYFGKSMARCGEIISD
jgi:hypothetical protein